MRKKRNLLEALTMSQPMTMADLKLAGKKGNMMMYKTSEDEKIIIFAEPDQTFSWEVRDFDNSIISQAGHGSRSRTPSDAVSDALDALNRTFA